MPNTCLSVHRLRDYLALVRRLHWPPGSPLVSRIAESEIRCREATFLTQAEREVQLLVNNSRQSRLSQMIPELIRRIAEG